MTPLSLYIFRVPAARVGDADLEAVPLPEGPALDVRHRRTRQPPCSLPLERRHAAPKGAALGTRGGSRPRRPDPFTPRGYLLNLLPVRPIRWGVMRAQKTTRRVVSALLALAAMAAPARARANGPVRILVLKEHGVGSASLVQPYLDRFIALAAERNGWAGAEGRYFTRRDEAESFVRLEKPDFGIFSLGAFLALRSEYRLDVIGQVAVTLAGGHQYYLISRHASGLPGCKGQTLASDHAEDRRFVDRVVARGAFSLGDFRLVATQRPLQTTKKVLTDEAVCALVDDAQLADLSHLQGSDGVRTVWQSSELPPMVVAAFPGPSPAERRRFQETLATLCQGDGESACAEVGIVSLRAAHPSDYARIVAAYGSP